MRKDTITFLVFVISVLAINTGLWLAGADIQFALGLTIAGLGTLAFLAVLSSVGQE